jgi:hypothetical protein
MFIEIDKNTELLAKYSKYQLVNIAFLLLKKTKKDREKMSKKVILTDLMDEVITKLANNQFTQAEIDFVIEEEMNA